jgi:adenylosuccinate synthase
VWLDRERRAGKRIPFEGAQGRCSTAPPSSLVNTVAAQAATRLRPRAGRDQLRARHHQATPRAWARGLSGWDETGRLLGSAARVRHGDRSPSPLRLVRRLPRAPDAESRRHQRHRPHQARRARPAAELKICVGYHSTAAIDYLPAAQAAQARVEPIYETMEG